jgi:hypothetical protein
VRKKDEFRPTGGDNFEMSFMYHSVTLVRTVMSGDHKRERESVSVCVCLCVVCVWCVGVCIIR